MIVSKLIYRLSSMYDALFSVCHGKILSALSGFFSVAILYKHYLVCFSSDGCADYIIKCTL